jgi:hypothetical protein
LDQHAARLRIVRRAVDRIGEPLVHRRRQRVLLLRAIEREGQDPLGLFDQDM